MCFHCLYIILCFRSEDNWRHKLDGTKAKHKLKAQTLKKSVCKNENLFRVGSKTILKQVLLANKAIV